MSARRLRVLTISKPYVALAYRAKLALLPTLGPFTAGLITPPAWGSQAIEPDPAPPAYWHKVVPILFNGRNHFHVYRGLEAAIREFGPDLINVEEEHYSLVTWQAFRIAARLGVPAIFYTWQNIAKRYPPPFSWIERQILDTAAAAVGGNDESIQILRAKGFRGRAVEIPQMGVELARFVPAAGERTRLRAALGWREDETWIGFIGRLVEEKGVDDLLDALVTTPRAVRALILGGGPHAEALTRRAATLGLHDRVVFREAVPSTEVPGLLKACDALCLPSRTRSNWKEQFGRVLVEAMAAGAVPIGSSSGEIPNVIADAGLVFPEGDVGALATAITRIAAEPDLTAALRRRGAARVRERYASEVIAARFAALFAEVLANAGHNPR